MQSKALDPGNKEFGEVYFQGMEFISTLDSFQESILACRPRDVLGFATRFFKDEKLSTDVEEAHCVHMLPYLLFNDSKFKSAAFTIFCRHISSDGANCQYIDSKIVCSVMARMDLAALGLQAKCIDEMAIAKVQGLKRIDFNLFLSCLRFLLNCYQLVVWVQDKITHIYKELGVCHLTSCSDSLNAVSKGTVGERDKTASSNSRVVPLLGCLQFRPPPKLELHRIKQYLNREQHASLNSGGGANGCSKYTSSALSKVDRWVHRHSCSYHMHECLSSVTETAERQAVVCGAGTAETERRLLGRTLLNTVDALIDSGKINTILLQELVDAFVVRNLAPLEATNNIHK